MIKKPKRNPSKVIAIDRPLKPSTDLHVIASDAESNRMIIVIGRQRFAYDVTARITQLPPTTGDQRRQSCRWSSRAEKSAREVTNRKSEEFRRLGEVVYSHNV